LCEAALDEADEKAKAAEVASKKTPTELPNDMADPAH
jgi:hypothetical protein